MLNLPPGEVDVNVHPQKSEVRFKTPQGVYLAVRRAIESALQELRGPGIAFEGRPDTAAVGAGAAVSEGQPVYSTTKSMALEGRAQQQGLQFLPQENVSEKQDLHFSELRYIGQLFSCYLLCESQNLFYIVDMHAAHERYNYNQIRQALSGKRASSQRLLLPLELKLDEQTYFNLNLHKSLLEKVGFELEFQEPGMLGVKGVPVMLIHADHMCVIKELAQEEFESGAEAALETRFDAIAARLACHASIRAGRELSREEVYALFQALDSTEFSAACPHGRPVVASFSEDQVERWFGRDR
jgi:DNA mismatch repair protein MutL